MSDLISRQKAKDAIDMALDHIDHVPSWVYDNLLNALNEVPSVKPTHSTPSNALGALDCVDRKAMLDILSQYPFEKVVNCLSILKELPSVQPERTCVNCGRTANNGGWYADGGTRCPIEEHYALPKDGYCHLWEERNVTDDDYPERREE